MLRRWFKLLLGTHLRLFMVIAVQWNLHNTDTIVILPNCPWYRGVLSLEVMRSLASHTPQSAHLQLCKRRPKGVLQMKAISRYFSRLHLVWSSSPFTCEEGSGDSAIPVLCPYPECGHDQSDHSVISHVRYECLAPWVSHMHMVGRHVTFRIHILHAIMGVGHSLLFLCANA